MQQVIVKSQPNGNMDKYTSPNDKLQTMDLETNTVRYDTGRLTRMYTKAQTLMFSILL